MNYFTAFVVAIMTVVFAGNDSRRISRYFNKHYSFQRVFNQTAAMIIGLLIYLPPLGLLFHRIYSSSVIAKYFFAAVYFWLRFGFYQGFFLQGLERLNKCFFTDCSKFASESKPGAKWGPLPSFRPNGVRHPFG